MVVFDDDFQWVGNSHNFSSEEECKRNASHCYKCYVRDEDFYKTFDIANQLLVIMIAGLGLIGNFTSIYILAKREFSSRFSNLLIMLAYADIRSAEPEIGPSHPFVFSVISV